MKSLRSLYRYGPGPSSSHTIAPLRAAEDFNKYLIDKNIDSITVILYGSLALTGKGHNTDKIISSVFNNKDIEIKFDYLNEKEHPNTMEFLAKGDELKIKRTYISLGGGEIECLEDESLKEKDIYPFKDFHDIKNYMNEHQYSYLYQVCLDFEDKDIYQYMEFIFDSMISVIDNGLKQEGKLQAGKNLYVNKVAKDILKNALKNKDRLERRISLLSAYAYAAGEENASGHNVVTSPTCGSSGVLPSIIYYLYKKRKISKKQLIFALMSAGLVGSLFKQNATISGAVGGCQAEIGVAVCMATVALCDVYKLNLYQLEYGCELAMEHQLGLTCDPIDGYVVIPCIERNAVGATRAVDAFVFAKCISANRKNVVNLDDIISTMKSTGSDIPDSYRETSKAGLAKLNKKN